MVLGFESFREQFKGYENQYTIIGGTACDLLMSDAGEDFRATKDIDIVLIVESLTPEFGKKFWEYVIDGAYEHKNKSTGKPQFYRFSHPKKQGFPFMLELFSRRSDIIPLPEKANVSPLSLDEELSSLSAILLDEDYYQFIRTGTISIDGVTILDAGHLIPLKAKAWLDLSAKKQSGMQHIDSKDIRKHKNDIYRLSTLLTAETRIEISDTIYADISDFVSAMENDTTDLKQIGIRNATKEELTELILATYVK